MKRIIIFTLLIVFTSSCRFIQELSSINDNSKTSRNKVLTPAKEDIIDETESIVNEVEEPHEVLVDESYFEQKEKEVEIASKVSDIILEAETYLGVPYRYGGTTRRGIDCSAFIQNVYKTKDIHLPRVTREQVKVGISVSRNDLQPGDMVFFSTVRRGASHVGIVHHLDEDGTPYFIHASSSKGITISSLKENYWSSRYYTTRRLPEFNEVCLETVGLESDDEMDNIQEDIESVQSVDSSR